MGNTRSEFFEPVSVDLWWDNSNASAATAETLANHKPTKPSKKSNEDRMEEISTLHEKRLKLIAEKKKEMNDLRQEVARQKNENEKLKEFLKDKGIVPPCQEWEPLERAEVGLQTETFEVPGSSESEEKYDEVKKKNMELQIAIAELQKELQAANSEILSFANERKEYNTHVVALKDIIAVSKQLLLMRENQIKELTKKIDEIQSSLAERELQAFSDDLRKEYERQLQNMKQLRTLYEERQRMEKTEKENLKSQLEEVKSDLKVKEDKNSELQARVDELDKENWKKYDTINSLESQLGLTKASCGELKAEMAVINQLFSQILVGFNSGQEVDLDKLIKTLEENHDLLTDIVVNEESNELSSALPKVLLDLVNQVNDKRIERFCDEESNANQATTLSTIEEESESQTSTQQNSLSSASEIVQNLPKVWKVLTELLSHQSGPVSVLSENNDQSDNNPCYKSVQTPTGSVLVLSVSKTFIRLKNLILEKKSLEKETSRLKQLNSHLETRLQDQEKRLETVSHELSKTWHVVGKMQKQHQQLHTQEKILRYELAQKRKLLNELKEELEYCREKWLQAREKNSTTEEQWRQLRTEFASRKTANSEDLNNSVESGYSDERESSSSSDEEDNSEAIAGCSGLAKEVKVEEIIDIVAKEIEEVENQAVNEDVQEEEKDQPILKVIKEEIAKIENCSDEPLQQNEEIVLNDNTGSTEAVHSEETLKTDLVQTLEVQKDTKTPEEIFAARDERLNRLEREAKELVAQTASTSNRSVEICTKLDDLHEHYGSDQNNRRKDIDDMYRKLEEDILQTIRKTQTGEEYPTTSKQSRTAEEILAAREERLKRLEEESNLLIDQASRTSSKSNEMCSKLDSLHQMHGECSTSTQNQEETATEEAGNSASLTTEEILARREERLQQMEEQAQQLVKGAIRNSWRGMQFYRKLSKLHERYGESTESSDDDAGDGSNNNNTEVVDRHSEGNTSAEVEDEVPSQEGEEQRQAEEVEEQRQTEEVEEQRQEEQS